MKIHGSGGHSWQFIDTVEGITMVLEEFSDGSAHHRGATLLENELRACVEMPSGERSLFHEYRFIIVKPSSASIHPSDWSSNLDDMRERAKNLQNSGCELRFERRAVIHYEPEEIEEL
jgi:hypothetical protein